MARPPERSPIGEESSEGAPEWVVTYGDMMSLLLVFFILIVSFSQMDVVKYRMLVGSLKSAFGARDASFMQGIQGEPSLLSLSRMNPERRRREEDEQAEETQRRIDALGLERDVHVTRSERGVALRIDENLLFDLGSAKLRPYAGPLLEKVSAILKTHPQTVIVEGHTDDLPIATEKFPSNWELSGARASAVVRYLVGRCGMRPEHLLVMGMADTRPVASNATAAGRQKNRRVEFLLSRIPVGPSRAGRLRRSGPAVRGDAASPQ